MKWIRKAFAVFRLAGYTIGELTLANLRVAVHLFSPLERLKPRIVRVPIEKASPAELVVLSNLITLTPGTLTVEVDEDLTSLYVHVMNAGDVEKVRKQIQTGFARRIKKVFE